MAEENNQYPFENETYRKTYWKYLLLASWPRPSSACTPEVKLAIGPPSTRLLLR